MIWVGPGVRARVTSMTAKPWNKYRVMCSLCKKEGHKAWDCPQQTECFRCKAPTHASADCPHCCICRKYGNLTEDCKAGQISTEDASRELRKKTKQNTKNNKKKTDKQSKDALGWKTSKSKTKPAVEKEKKPENFIPPNSVGSNITTNNDSDEDSETSFMGDEEFQEAILGKRKFDDTDSDSPTAPLASKKEKLNGKGESKGPHPTTNNDSDEDSEISLMDDEEFQEAILGKSKFDDTDSDYNSTISIQERKIER